MKLKTWHWVVILLAVVAIIIWVVMARKKAEEERLAAIRAQTGATPIPTGSNLANILNAIFPFFERATEKKP